MNIVLHFLKIFFLLGVQFCLYQATPTPTPNPECSGVDKAVKHAQQAIKSLTGKSATCKRNPNCTGLSCSGTFQGKPLSIKIELRHCDNPVSAHVDLTYDGKGFNKNVKDGHVYTIVNEPIVKIKLRVRLKRNGNIVMAGLTLLSCPIISRCSNYELLNQNFTVVMRNCPGYSTVSPPPTRPTSKGPATHTASIARKTTLPKTHSTAPPPTTRKTTTAHSGKPKSRETAATESPPRTKLHSITEKPNSTHSHEPVYGRRTGGKKKSGLSSGQAAGIAVGCIMAVLIIVGVLFYYKRCYGRSRLRAAYYNDISMNDPLYDDFGPEIA